MIRYSDTNGFLLKSAVKPKKKGDRAKWIRPDDEELESDLDIESVQKKITKAPKPKVPKVTKIKNAKGVEKLCDEFLSFNEKIRKMKADLEEAIARRDTVEAKILKAADKAEVETFKTDSQLVAIKTNSRTTVSWKSLYEKAFNKLSAAQRQIMDALHASLEKTTEFTRLEVSVESGLRDMAKAAVKWLIAVVRKLVEGTKNMVKARSALYILNKRAGIV